MLWTTKLTQSGLKESDFGQRFSSNVKKYNKLSAALDQLKKDVRKPGADVSQINADIEVLIRDIADVNKKLISNINRTLKNPDLAKANKERMATIRGTGKTVPAATVPAVPPATPPVVPVVPPVSTAVPPEPAKPKTEPAPKTSTSAEPKKTATTVPAKKPAKNLALKIGGVVLLLLLAAAGVKKAMKK